MTNGNGGAPGDSAAFFDVDETLINIKSMFSYLDFYLWRRGEPGSTYAKLAGELKEAAAGGVPRREINRRYYRFFAGESARHLATVGREWFTVRADEGLFVPETTDELAAQRGRGSFVVLLSGSFFACLEPIAEHVNADWAIGTRPVVRRGTLTGEVVTPMIGAAKGRAARATAAVRGLDLARCSAYGDHSSDMDLLMAVGHPVVVGDDPALVARAQQSGWRRLAPRTLEVA